MEKLLDVIIIGGGPAGLNAALLLGRSRKSVLVIDEGKARNRVTHEAHGFLTRDGIEPAEFKRIAMEQIGQYPSVQFVSDAAVTASGTDGHFEIMTAQGTSWHAKKLLFAVGKKDLPLDIAGLTEVYGKSAFVCPYCDGWELRDQPLVSIVSGAHALHMAKVLSGWTDQITICTNGSTELTAEHLAEIKRHNISVSTSPIRQIESVDGIVQHVVLDTGERISCRGIFFAPKLAGGSDLPQALGCKMTDTGSIIVDSFGKTNIPGVFGAGDAASEMYQAIMAAAQGSIAGAGINHELLMEAWDGKVAE
jgi:thioredoxin reductase